MDLVRIIEENFLDLDPQVLLDPKWYPDVEEMAMSIDAAHTADYAKTYAQNLADKLDEVAEQMPRDLFLKYAKLLKALMLASLLETPDKEKDRFIKENILDTFGFDWLDVQEEVEYIFRAYYNAQDIIDGLRGLFEQAIEHNKELLGSKNIKVFAEGKDKELPPTVANWLSDYNANTPADPATKTRGGYQEASYISKAPNVRTLNKDQQEVLLKILKFYDWLRYSPFRYNFSLPGQAPRQDRELVVDKPQKYIPDDLVQSINDFRDQQAKQTPAEAGRVVIPVPLPKVAPEQEKEEAEVKISTLSPLGTMQTAPGSKDSSLKQNPVNTANEQVITQYADIRVEKPLPSFVMGARLDGPSPINLQELLKKNIAAAEQQRGVQMTGGTVTTAPNKASSAAPTTLYAARPTLQPSPPAAVSPAPTIDSAKPAAASAAEVKKQQPSEEDINKKLEALKNKATKS